MKSYNLGKLAGLEVRLKPTAVVASLLLWAVLSAVAYWLLRLTMIEALVGGLAAVGLHWVSDVMHQLGHAWVARRLGYPMQRLHFIHLLVAGTYPRDEVELPAATHIRRALGGPPVSFLLGIIGGIVALLLQPAGGLPYWLALFFALENIFIFGLGAFLPLGFTDGSTLLEWWPKRG